MMEGNVNRNLSLRQAPDRLDHLDHPPGKRIEKVNKIKATSLFGMDADRYHSEVRGRMMKNDR